MTYRVVNLTTGEIVAELHQQYFARQLADKLAADANHREQLAVIEMVTIYETPLRNETA